MAQSPCTGLLFFHLQIYTHATIVHVHAYAPPPPLSPSPPSFRLPLALLAPTLLYRLTVRTQLFSVGIYSMPFGLKPAQLNWQREVTNDDRGNIIDMIN